MKLFTLGYLRKDGKTLMIHRVKKDNDLHKNLYNGLGGKFENGESPEECFIREIYEESKLKVEIPKLVGILTFPKLYDGEDGMVFVFTCDSFEGNMKYSNHEGNLEWIDDDKILDLPLFENDYIFFSWIIEGKFFSAKFIYNDDKKLEDWSVNFY